MAESVNLAVRSKPFDKQYCALDTRGMSLSVTATVFHARYNPLKQITEALQSVFKSAGIIFVAQS